MRQSKQTAWHSCPRQVTVPQSSIWLVFSLSLSLIFHHLIQMHVGSPQASGLLYDFGTDTLQSTHPLKNLDEDGTRLVEAFPLDSVDVAEI